MPTALWPATQGPPESPGMTLVSAKSDHTHRLGRLMSPEPSPIHCHPTLRTLVQVHPVRRPLLQTGIPTTVSAWPVTVTVEP